MYGLLLAGGVVAHVGGIPTQAQYQRPVTLGELGDATARIEWRDNEQDMTGLFDFYYQPSNIRPSVMSTHPDFAGTLFAEGVPIMDTTNYLDWDTSAVPAGSYYIYEITRDAPLAPVYSVTPAPITVQHAGDARWPAVMVIEPDGVMDTQPSRFAIKWNATGEGTLSARIRYGEVGNDALTDITSGAPMADQGDGFYEGCYLWNISLLAQGTYYILVEVGDEGGHSHSAFSRNVLVVYRDPDAADGGVEPSCEGVGAVDGGTGRDGAGADGGDDGGNCLCRVGHRGRAPLGAAILFGALVAGLRARPRRRR